MVNKKTVGIPLIVIAPLIFSSFLAVNSRLRRYIVTLAPGSRTGLPTHSEKISKSSYDLRRFGSQNG